MLSEEMKERINKVLSILSPRERDVLRLRFGMDDGRQRTLEEVGELFGQTAEAIRVIEAKALKKINKILENIDICDYFKECADEARKERFNKESEDLSDSDKELLNINFFDINLD